MANPKSDERSNQQEQRHEKSASQIGQQARQATSEATRASYAAADLQGRALRAGVDLAQHNAEAFQETWRSATDALTNIAALSTNHFGRFMGISGDESERTAQRSSDNVEALLQSGNVLTEKAAEFSREWIDLNRKWLTGLMERSDAYLQCKSPQDAFALQTEFTRDGVGMLLASIRRFSEISARAVDEATRKMEQARVAA